MGLEETLEAAVGQLLKKKGLTLATAESCTGGLIGHRITNIPGASDYFLGGVAAYAYEAKEKLLGVKKETLERFGAVSKETVLEMARGARQAIGTQIGLSVSGIAGPGGGMPGKPVGLVWIGLSAPDGEWAWRCQFNGSRIEIKDASAEKALQILYNYLQGKLDGSN